MAAAEVLDWAVSAGDQKGDELPHNLNGCQTLKFDSAKFNIIIVRISRD